MFNTATLAATDDRVAAAGSCAASQPIAGNWASVSFADLVGMLGGSLAPDARAADITFPVRRLKPGEVLHRAGDKFDAIYVVRSGFLKAVSVDKLGAEQVLAFPMGGDVIGLDGIDPGRYTSEVIALDTTHVIVVSFARLAHLGHDHVCVEPLLYRMFSRELVRERTMIWLLGTLDAEARVAAFLFDLSERFGRLGCSRSSFLLRMTREEIGSYLGIKLETVSRTLSTFAAAGLILVDRKEVTLLDMPALRRIMEPQEERVARSARPARPAPARAASRPQLRPALAMA